MSRFTTILRSRMEALDHTEASLAKAIDVHKSTITRALNGQNIEFRIIMKICAELRISPVEVVAALYPDEMKEIRKALPASRDLSENIATDLARAGLSERLMDLSDDEIQAIWVLVGKRKG